MSLGNNIHRLRTKLNMSQGDLAEALGVSRQSISKWETDGAVPELDKLIKLSNIFGVTLDELVHGEEAIPTPVAESVPAEKPNPNTDTRHKTIALVFLILAVLCLACCTVLGSFAIGLILMIPFLLGSLVSLLCRRHPLLSACWAMLILVDLYLRFATGLSWAAIKLTPYWSYEMNYFCLFMAWMQFACILFMLLATALTMRKTPLTLTGSARTRYILGWVGMALLTLLIRLNGHNLGLNHMLVRLLYHLLDWCRIGLFTVQVSKTLRWWITRRTSP